MNASHWTQIWNASTLATLAFVNQSNDTIVLRDCSSNTYYALNSLCLFNSSLNSCQYSGSWQIVYFEATGITFLLVLVFIIQLYILK